MFDVFTGGPLHAGSYCGGTISRPAVSSPVSREKVTSAAGKDERVMLTGTRRLDRGRRGGFARADVLGVSRRRYYVASVS